MCTVSFISSAHKPFAFEGLFMLLTYITAYFITLASVRTRKQQRILVYVIISTAVLISIIAILKRFGLTPVAFWIYPDVGGISHTSNSAAGVYVNRNHMAGFLEMAIPLLMILFITRQRPLETKLGLIFLVIFLLTTQAFTLSRGGWISTINAILFLSAVLLARKNYAHTKAILTIGTGIIIISLFILASLPVVERITTLTQQDPTDNISGRMRCWKGVINQIKDNPLTGTGPDTFTTAYSVWQIPGHAVLRRYAHNDYLHFIAETGILFIPVLIYTLFCFFRSGFQKIKSRSRQTRGFALGAMAAVFAILIHSFSDFNLNIPANAFVFTVIAGIIGRDRGALSPHNPHVPQK
ncbi:MAG: O-antigen ligase family protein [Desulfobacula sp.]|nr:O-antigen ligase family protein [Desulfobacula sp.]